MKPEKNAPNISINSKNFELLEQQQELYPLLTKGELINNILDCYFKGTAGWIKQKNRSTG